MVTDNTYGVTSEGFVTKSFTDILTQLNSDTQDVFPGADVSNSSIFGSLNGLFSLELARGYQVLQTIATSFDPLQAEGPALDTIAFYRGITRNIDELDSDFRIRIIQTTQIQGSSNSQRNRICSALKDIPFVNNATVIVNETSETSASGIPPNAYVPVIYIEPDAGQCIAEITNEQITSIAETLVEVHPVGVNMFAPPEDAGYNSYLFSTLCGTCIDVKFILATKVVASAEIDYRAYPSCTGCGIQSSAAFNQTVATFLNSSENCDSISPTLYGATLAKGLTDSGNVEVLNYKFRLHECGHGDCSFFYEQSGNTPLDVSAALLSLSLSDNNPISTNYAFVEFDSECFNSRLV